MEALMMIVLVTSGARVQPLQRLMLKSFCEPIVAQIAFPVCQLSLEYDACPPTVSCTTAYTCFHAELRSTNDLVLPLIHSSLFVNTMLQYLDAGEIDVKHLVLCLSVFILALFR